MFRVALIFGLIAFANAECHAGCNGNGLCTNQKMGFSGTDYQTQENQVPVDANTYSTYGYYLESAGDQYLKKDSCTCFSRMEDGKEVYAYTGADCSLMTCPYGSSWDGAPYANNRHDMLKECSDRGVCNRDTGDCECFAGFEGKGCRRSTCPNQCSQHGVCKTLNEITYALSERTAWNTFSEFDYTKIGYKSAWDANKIRGCECDAGWRGPDCSIQESPSKDDPMGGHGHESGRECSGRGFSDGAGGCTCYTGFFGAACNQQRANVF
jgi:hypothetical protein